MLRDLARSRPLVRIRYHRNLALPRLSWLCEVWLPPTELIVHLGSGVEASDSFFVEGVWNADFAAGAFERTGCRPPPRPMVYRVRSVHRPAAGVPAAAPVECPRRKHLLLRGEQVCARLRGCPAARSIDPSAGVRES